MDPPQTMDILKLPQVVLQDYLFPLLNFNDLLRLRRVSKTVKAVAEEHIRCYHVNVPREMEITQEPGENSLAAFVALGIPTARLYINNADGKVYEDPVIPEFLEQFGSKITHLRIRNFYAFVEAAEMTFFEALPNLEHVELENIDATGWQCDFAYWMLPNGKKIDRPPSPVAKSFKNLKTILFGHTEARGKHDHFYWMDVLNTCYEDMEYIGHPKYDHPLRPNNNPDFPGLPKSNIINSLPDKNTGTFICIENVLGKRQINHSNKPNLKYYDLDNFDYTRQNVESFLDYIYFAGACHQLGVKLLNVPSDLYHAVGPCKTELFQMLVSPLQSLKNLSRSLFLDELPFLEKVVVTKTSKCSYYPVWNERRGKPQWPQLKTLDLTIDSEELDELILEETIGTQDTTELYEFLFTRIVREKLVTLAIRFDEKAALELGGRLPCPRTAEIRGSCPNIKQLTLDNWVGTNKALSSLWRGLSCLEELVMRDCKGLGNVAFVGEKKEEPTFLKLKKLKILTLGGLDGMPKITNTVFTLVFRHLPLKKFFLTSRNPIRNISTTGITSLLSGEFAKTIERFPFKEWSLAGASSEEFKSLEREFRSYFMI